MDVFYYVTGSVFVAATLIAGGILKLCPPKKINSYFGFRTKTTSKSQEAWDYAHRICGNTLLLYSLFSIIFYIVLLVINPSFIRGNIFIVMILGFVLAALGVIITAIIVEIKTKKFNKLKN